MIYGFCFLTPALLSHVISRRLSAEEKTHQSIQDTAATVAAPKGSTHRPRHSRGLDKEDGKMMVFIWHFCTLSTPRALYSWPHSPIHTKRFLYTFFAQVLSILYSHPDECIGEHLRVSILPKSTCSLEQPVCNHKLPITRRPMLPPEL